MRISLMNRAPRGSFFFSVFSSIIFFFSKNMIARVRESTERGEDFFLQVFLFHENFSQEWIEEEKGIGGIF